MQLSDKIESHFPKLDTNQKKALARLGLSTIHDLLYYFPARYSDISELHFIRDLVPGESVTVLGKVTSATTKKSFKTRIPMGEAVIEDTTGSIKVVWFNQAYLAKMFRVGDAVKVTGKVIEMKNGGLSLTNPEIEKVSGLPIERHDTLFVDDTDTKTAIRFPVYPETRGLTSKWLYHAIGKILKSGVLESIEEYIPEDILERYHLPTLKTALIWIHTPRHENDALAARKRFAFEEVFFIQLQKQQDKKRFQELRSYTLDVDIDDVQRFVDRFPFQLTGGQERAIESIFDDFEKSHPMSRLLEGDVGSGKTAIAASAAYAVIKTRPFDFKENKTQTYGNLQVAYMAPTEILATQLFESFITYFEHTGISIGLMTGSGCRKFPSKVTELSRSVHGTNAERWTSISKNQLLKWVENGEIPILIGTHSLIQKTVRFKHLALVIIDEQHRFGVNQRFQLARGKYNTTTAKQEVKQEQSDPLLYRDLTYRIRQCLFAVKKELGPGHKEVIYQRALEIEFTKAKLNFNREVKIPILYNKKKIGVYIPDFVIEEKVIVELKALPFLGSQEKKQLWQYLKGSDYKLGLLANYGPKELEIERVINDKSRISSVSVPQSSASVPHLLSMTATPIPRTLALTIYGDLDLTVLDEMPAGRKKVITEIVPDAKRDGAYELIKKEMALGRQLYVICPRIADAEQTRNNAEQTLQMNSWSEVKSVTEEAKRLKKSVFPEKEIGVLHSKMTKEKKESVMLAFARHEIDILVATSVVEVGVNVPNATMIIIEGAERFGLAQLHQLRGRVMRSSDQPYCFLFADAKTEKTADRLMALKTAKSGFELAELDLKLRGAGELGGGKQWGVTDLGMEAIKNLKMVEAARTEAREIIEKNKLTLYPHLEKKLAEKGTEVHFE